MVSKHIKRKVSELWGNQCAVCGAVDYLEYHHLIPKTKGGTDDYDNLILLCACCHAAVHNRAYDPQKYKNNASMDYEKALPILEDYFNERIGARETKKRLNLSEKTHLSESALIKRYKRENHIIGFYNHVDLINSKRSEHV